MTLDKKRKRKPKKIKRQLSRIEPYFQPQFYTQATAATTAGTFNFTLDGYDYVTIRDLIAKINQIIDYIKGEK